VKKGKGFALVFGSQADLLAGGGVLGVVNRAAPKQDELPFHNEIFLVLNREPVRYPRVSE
jgi:hypothetical protein